MGSVYLAEQEPPLRRRVAAKILKSGFVTPEMLARFEVERQALASLQHPAIAQVYDAGTAPDGRPYFVMEYVPGLPLTEYCDSHRLDLRQRLELFVMICRAIHHAHQNGIVHRDLKPANILVSAENGTPSVKVIDFGLAKALSPGPTDPTVSTQLGILMGTPAYMAPEQADPFRRHLDHRVDIYSLGAILYELLTGLTPVDSATNRAVLARELKGDLNWIVQKALETKPEQRYADVAEFANAVERFLRRQPLLRRRLGLQYRARRFFGRRRAAVIAAATLAAAVLFGLNRWFFGTVGLDMPPARLVPLTSFPGNEMRPALSPDGTQVAFFSGADRSDEWGLYVMTIGSPETRRLTRSPNHDNFAKWSPDGRWIAFARFHYSQYAGARIHIVPSVGGPDSRVSDFPASGPISWSADGRYIAASRWAPDDSSEPAGVFVIPVSGGSPRPLTPTQTPARDSGVAFSPDGRRLAYASCTPQCDVYILALDGDLTALGPPKRITSQPSRDIENITWARDGRSVIYDSFISDSSSGLSHLMRVDVDGRRAPERIELAGLNAFGPSTARTMDRMAFSRHLSDRDIYTVRTDLAGALRVLSSTFPDYDPQFSPDGNRIVFASARSGRESELWVADSDGSRAQRLLAGPGRWQSSPQWSPDGQRIAFQVLGNDGRFHIWTVDAAGKAPARLTTRTSDEWFPSWSRDGRMIYFSAEEEGRRWDIWRVPTSRGTPERVTFTGNAWKGFESPDRTRLVFQERFPKGQVVSDTSWPTRVLVQSLNGGDPAKVVDCAMGGSLTAGPREFYYADCSQTRVARVLDIDSGTNRPLARLEGFSGASFAVRTRGEAAEILYTRDTTTNVDLFLIDDFK